MCRTMHMLRGLGDLVSRLITPITHIKTPISPLLTYLLSPHDPTPKILTNRVFLNCGFALLEHALLVMHVRCSGGNTFRV